MRREIVSEVCCDSLSKKWGMEMPVYKSITDVARRLTMATTLAVALTTGAFAAEPVKMGIVVFLSGPAAGPVGVPSRNAAEIVIEAINAGKLPRPTIPRAWAGRRS